ncbi:hypothetical protein KR51_00009780 [Rubidibacter lacunae KORDI 51-2]|uniref:Uncharacterized protein n=1 Tax=Rubidibacter lacunae KORDI 51-2 TaxID=582515 RepID=U5DRL5_9CHRO|nr:hypothetical protein [Rubidibacter lacunae]ERN42335.1 hypothetical protein KR51_00009780 [Rubidibacter lacunae KORDI 51-2]
MVGLVKGLFGGQSDDEQGQTQGKKKKKSGYYLELDPEQGESVPTQEDSAAVPAELEQPPTTAAPAPVEAAQPAATTPVAPAAPMPTPPTPEPDPDRTFAPDYLVPSTKSARRRPGANMEMFRSLARDMNTPR